MAQSGRCSDVKSLNMLTSTSRQLLGGTQAHKIVLKHLMTRYAAIFMDMIASVE